MCCCQDAKLNEAAESLQRQTPVPRHQSFYNNKNVFMAIFNDIPGSVVSEHFTSSNLPAAITLIPKSLKFLIPFIAYLSAGSYASTTESF